MDLVAIVPRPALLELGPLCCCAPDAHCLCFSSQLCVVSRSLCARSTCDTHLTTHLDSWLKKKNPSFSYHIQFAVLLMKDGDLHMGDG